MKNQTHMTLVALLAAMLLALPTAVLSDPIKVTDTVTITGSLSNTDPIGFDGDGTFYYDIIEFEATSDLDLLITLVTGTDSFRPYLAWGIGIPTPLPEPTADDLDAPYSYFAIDDCRSTPGSVSVPHWYPTSGQVFQVVVATCDYREDWSNPDDYILGDYSLTLAEVAEVPEPGSLALFGIGLVGLAALRRRRQRSLRSSRNFLSV